MIAWIRRLWRNRFPRSEGRRVDLLRALLEERRRLDGMIACYQEFGFDAMIPECRGRRADLDRRIRRWLGENSGSPASRERS